jgi:ribosomal protein L13
MKLVINVNIRSYVKEYEVDIEQYVAIVNADQLKFTVAEWVVKSMYATSCDGLYQCVFTCSPSMQ